MDRPDVPDDYEERLAAGRRAVGGLPAGPGREAAVRALAGAPDRSVYGEARERAALADALVEEVRQAAFDGTDPERVAWLRLDHEGRLRALAFSPTVDRLTNPAAAGAVGEAWAAAEEVRVEAARRMAPAAARLGSGPVHPGTARLRAELEARSGERFAHTDVDELCEVEVDVEGRLRSFKFLVPNATLEYDCETLAERAAAAIAVVQARAADAVAAIAARCFE